MLPWPEMFWVGLSAGVQPQNFWQLSLREWRWLRKAETVRLPKSALLKLMKEHPDG